MAGYIGSTPVPQGIQEQQSFTATAGQTTFNTLGYTDGNTIRVTLNGVLLEGGGVDYTATNGSDIVLTAAASVDDVLTFETFNEFQLVSQTMTTPTISGGTLKSNVTLKNDTEQDTDGGRASKIIYQGEQSGGEISTLAEIQASHDGTADDEKADLIFRVNDGNDGTSPTEVLRIDSAGRVGVGTDPAAITDGTGVRNIQLGATFLSHFTPDQDGTTSISNNVYWNGSNNKALFTGPQTAYLQQDRSHRFRTGASVSAGSNATLAEVVRIDNEGIKFNGDTAADNALDDYEQGTFTAAVKGYTTNPTTATNMSGTYTKIGNFVSLHMTLAAGNLSGASGYIYFEHMPFSCANIALGNIMHYNVITHTLSGHTDVSTRLGGTQMTVYGSGSNVNWGVANHNGSTNAYIDISINYLTS